MMNIDSILKTLDARSEELGIDISTRANLNAYFQSMKDISMDSELSFELKKKKLELLEEEYTEKININGANSQK
jgi:hypothetical protein